MNREIKFRIIYRDKINGYERLTHKEGNIFWEWMCLDLNPDNGSERWVRGVYPHSFEYIRNQFTGLKDKEGKEIYEGDIIELINADGHRIRVLCEYGTARRQVMGLTLVEVDITGFYFILPNGHKSFPLTNNYLGKHDLEIFEIIGNIFEHRHLLEK